MHLQSALRKTIVFVTHDIDEALRLADRLATPWLRAGRITRTGRWGSAMAPMVGGAR